jgi:hypothetical protein
MAAKIDRITKKIKDENRTARKYSQGFLSPLFQAATDSC